MSGLSVFESSFAYGLFLGMQQYCRKAVYKYRLNGHSSLLVSRVSEINLQTLQDAPQTTEGLFELARSQSRASCGRGQDTGG